VGVDQTAALRNGVAVSLVTLALAALFGLIAVFDADQAASAAATGFGVAWILFLAGAAIACSLACLVRGRLVVLALGAAALAGLAADLLVLALWLDIDSEAYGKLTLVAFVWALIGLVVLGLTLAVGAPGAVAGRIYVAAVLAGALVGVLASWLVLTVGGGTTVESVDPSAVLGGSDVLLRLLGAAFVLLAALWFAALAASRIDRREPA
jgi:hypothetical protein